MGPRFRGDDDGAPSLALYKLRPSNPANDVFDRLFVLVLRLLLLALLLLGAMTPIEAAGGRTEHAMVTGVVTGDAADHGALQAALGLGGASGRESERCGDC